MLDKVALSKLINKSNPATFMFNYDKLGEYTFLEWKTILKQVAKNEDFVIDNKMEHINNLLYMKAKNNLEKILKVGFPLTQYIITRQAKIYNSTTYIRAKNDSHKNYVNELSLKKALIDTALSFYLNKAGAILINDRKDHKKLYFESISLQNIIYDLGTEEYLLYRKNISNGYKLYEYSISVEKTISKYEELQILDNSTYLNNILVYLDKAKKMGKYLKLKIVATSFQEAYQLVYLKMSGKLDKNLNKFVQLLPSGNVSNVTFIFKNKYEVAQINSICDNDAIISVLYSLGLMGVPQELLTKFIFTRGDGVNATSSDKKMLAKELSEYLALVYLNGGENLNQFKTGEVRSMNNLVDFFNKIYNQICTFSGIPAPFSVNASGGSLIVDAKASQSFSENDKILFDELENNIFSKIEQILDKKFSFLNYKKGKFYLSTSSEKLNEEILRGVNGLTTPVDSIMVLDDVSEKVALETYKNIEKFREEHPVLYSGIAGMNTVATATKGQTMYPDKNSEKGNQGELNDKS